MPNVIDHFLEVYRFCSCKDNDVFTVSSLASKLCYNCWTGCLTFQRVTDRFKTFENKAIWVMWYHSKRIQIVHNTFNNETVLLFWLCCDHFSPRQRHLLVIASKALKSGNRMKSSCPKKDWIQQENPRIIIIISINSWKWYFHFVDAGFKYYADVHCLSASLARIFSSVELKTKMKWILVDVAKWNYHSKTSSVRLQTLSFAELLNVSHLPGQSYLTKVYTCFSTRQAQPKTKLHMLTILTALVIHHSSNRS